MKAARFVVLAVAIAAGGAAALLAGHSDSAREVTRQAAPAIQTVVPPAGELIRQAKLIDAKSSQTATAMLPSMRAVPMQISPRTGANGFILPNDQVDVILTHRDREAETTVGGETILGNVRVLAIDQDGRTATLELASRQSETLALAQQLGSLSLAPHSMSGAHHDNLQADEKPDPRSGGVTVIRFGVRTAAIPR